MQLQPMNRHDGKTPAMVILEMADPAHREIREIVAEALRQAGTVTGAAEALKVDKGTVSRWLPRLGLKATVELHVESSEDRRQ